MPAKKKEEFNLATAFSAVKRDLEAEKEGVWLPIPDIEQDIEFKIRSADYEPYTQLVTKKIRNYKEQTRSKTVPEKRLSEIMAEATARHLVIDWRGEGVKGQPFDKEQVIAIFTDPSYSLIADYVHDQASKAATFRQELREDAAKNS